MESHLVEPLAHPRVTTSNQHRALRRDKVAREEGVQALWLADPLALRLLLLILQEPAAMGPWCRGVVESWSRGSGNFDLASVLRVSLFACD